MSSVYTIVAKPTDASYTRVSARGKEYYDNPAIIYDLSDVLYDGGDITSYVLVSKPSRGTWNEMTTIWNSTLTTWDNPLYHLTGSPI